MLVLPPNANMECNACAASQCKQSKMLFLSLQTRNVMLVLPPNVNKACNALPPNANKECNNCPAS